MFVHVGLIGYFKKLNKIKTQLLDRDRVEGMEKRENV